jgi:hypothetical protein
LREDLGFEIYLRIHGTDLLTPEVEKRSRRKSVATFERCSIISFYIFLAKIILQKMIIKYQIEV